DVIMVAGPIGSGSAPARRPPRSSVSHEAVDIEYLLRVQHVVEGPAQLVGRRRQRLGLARPRRRPVEQGADALVLLGRQHGGLAEGPLQPGVAGLAVSLAGALAGRLLHRAAPAAGRTA